MEHPRLKIGIMEEKEVHLSSNGKYKLSMNGTS